MLRFYSLALLLAAGCAVSPTDDDKQPEGPSAQFETSVGHSYSFVWRRSCECTTETTRAMRIDVIRDEIVSAHYVDTDEPVPTEVRDGLMTIHQIFTTIDEATAEAAAITVDYDASLGFPRSLVIDYSTDVADEELVLQIGEVSAIGGPGCGGAPE